MDLDAETYAIIEANTREGIRINSYAPPDPCKEDVMGLDNASAQRAKAAALIKRMQSHNRNLKGPQT